MVTLITASYLDRQQLNMWANISEICVGSQAGVQGEAEETDHSRLVSDRCKQGNSHTRHVLGSPKTSSFLHLPTRILKVYQALSPGSFSIPSSGLNKTLQLQGCVLGRATSSGKASRTQIARTEERVRSLWLPGAHRWTSSHVLSMTFSNSLWQI